MPRKKSSRKKTSPKVSCKYTVHLIAAAAGELLHGLANVAITQFPDIQFQVVLHSLQDTIEKLESTLAKIAGDESIVLHALADESAKHAVREKCVARRIPQFDATGELMRFFSRCVGALPRNDVSRLHRIDSHYTKRIAAMEFTMEHDDSLGLKSLKEADVVILGVSRVSKTPVALYLGSRGYKVANVSLTPECGIPKELARLSKKRVVAFTMQPKRLQQIRNERANSIGLKNTAYNDLRSITHELMDVETEYKSRGFEVIDVTNLTIEQTAAKIINLIDSKHR